MQRHVFVSAGCAVSLALGLLFLFGWAPHPWGWLGFDHYYELALDLAHGRPFATMEYPWGYAYFLAAFYRLFGDRLWIPLLAQVLLNATLPALVFVVARSSFDGDIAAVAALITGIFSFNTVYASTQSSDAVCTWLFILALWLFLLARQRNRARWFAATGLLTGIAAQFRPNLILIPGILAMYAAAEQRTARRIVHAAVLVACAVLALLPWIVRNFRLTGTVIPTSVHAGVQLWYGTLQVGPYLRSRAYNPRSAFESPIFEYTSLDRVPIVVQGDVGCGHPPRTTLVYWFDDDPTMRNLEPAWNEGRRYSFQIPAPRRSVVVYYYFETAAPHEDHGQAALTPSGGRQAPFVYFVSHDHLGDRDIHGDLVDIFDVIRLARLEAWREPARFADRLRAAGMTDARTAIVRLLRPLMKANADQAVTSIERSSTDARIVLADDSSVSIPRQWHGSISEVTFNGRLATNLMNATLRWRELMAPPDTVDTGDACRRVHDIAVNQVFYRSEPQMMRRYLALASDNIRHDPGAFAMSCAYRAVRLFTIQGTSDPSTAQQFAHSRRVYAAAAVASALYLALFVAGVIVAVRKRFPIALPLLLIAYLPLTLAPVLTNMRYTLTVQPLMFMFIAAAIVTSLRSRHAI
jgi:dolichyl-phosphate-mannose-protein mannosyltransferase